MELMKIAEPHGPAIAIMALSGALTHVVRSAYPQERRAQAFRDLCAKMIENYDKVSAGCPGSAAWRPQ
jgi:hypothetical protein